MARRNLATLVILSLSASPMLLAADIQVPQDFGSIQAAIDAAQSGDRVLVAPGTYAEQLSISDKNITLESTSGAAQTVIDGQGSLG